MLSPIQTAKRLVRGGQSRLARLLNSFPKIIECNLCGWQGRRFDGDSWHPYTICPQCESLVRHRLLAAALSPEGSFPSETIVKGKAVLHFAPEKVIADLLRKTAGRYVTSDFGKAGADLRLDISNMPSIKTGEFDLVIACDILEHVPADAEAMREIYRVLRPGGLAILTVPQKDRLEGTFEDKTVVDSKERERVFGQTDHLRIYGDNFPKLLEEKAGFSVTAVSAENFPAAMVKRNVLFPPVLSQHPLATNYRKVFFARKGGDDTAPDRVNTR